MTAWLRYARATPELIRVSLAGLVAYRAEMTIWILTSTLPLVMLALWNAVAAEGPVGTLDQTELARYFTANLVVRQLTGAWIVWELNWDIRSGGLSAKLLRPIHPLWLSAIWMIAALPFRVIILAPLIGALLWWRPELWQLPSAAGLAMFLVSVSLAWVIAYLVQAIFGMLAFWFDQSMGLFGVWFGLWTVLSGYVAPMEAFPHGLRQVLELLPFHAMLATPVNLLAGFTGPSEAWPALLVQLGWTLAFGLLAGALWTRGVQRYGAYGA